MGNFISNGVKITANGYYSIEHSLKSDNIEKVFIYKIIITNLNSFNIQLISRYWLIFDSLSPVKTVEGEGVIGQQPMIMPNESYEYFSSCYLRSEMGYMKGYYVMKNLADNSKFKATIPKFNLIYPFKFN